jgi:hypothetical protein
VREKGDEKETALPWCATAKLGTWMEGLRRWGRTSRGRRVLQVLKDLAAKRVDRREEIKWELGVGQSVMRLASTESDQGVLCPVF